MRAFVSAILILQCHCLCAVDVCAALIELAAKHPDSQAIKNYIEHSRYLPQTDRAAYETVNGETKLVTLERFDVSLDERGEVVLTGTQAFPATGPLAPMSYRIILPGSLNETPAGFFFQFLSPAYLKDSPDGEGLMPTWYLGSVSNPVFLETPYKMSTLPSLTVRGITYHDVRRIEYKIMTGNRLENRRNISLRRIAENDTVDYVAPGAGVIRAETTHRVVLTAVSTGSTVGGGSYFSLIETEPIRPGTYEAGLFAEHLATLAVGRGNDDFQKEVTRRLGKPLSSKQAWLVYVIYQSARSTTKARFDKAMSNKEMLDWFHAGTLTDEMIEIAEAVANDFLFPG